MTNVERVKEYLDKCRMFFVSTVDGDRPRNRPFGFNVIYDDKLFFGVGTFKDCYKQMIANPNVEISASDGNGFLRYYGKAVFVEDEELTKAAFEAAPNLTRIYNDETGYTLGLFYLTDATAEFRSLFAVEESLEM